MKQSCAYCFGTGGSGRFGGGPGHGGRLTITGMMSCDVVTAGCKSKVEECEFGCECECVYSRAVVYGLMSGDSCLRWGKK